MSARRTSKSRRAPWCAERPLRRPWPSPLWSVRTSRELWCCRQMAALQVSRAQLKRKHEEEMRLLQEKKRKIDENEAMQAQIAAALGQG